MNKFKYFFLIIICISFSFAPEKNNLNSVQGQLELGKIVITKKSDNCGTGKCYSFSTSSNLVEQSKAGVIKIDEPLGKVKGTVVMYSGNLGTYFFGDWSYGADLIAELRSQGYRTIQVKWDKGWFIGSKGKYEGFKKLAVHPATVTNYIYKTFAEKEKPFVLFGGSGGAAQISYMLSSYGIDKIANVAIAYGGFWMGRLDIGCFDKDSINDYMHYSDIAKSNIDLSFGFDSLTKGPCSLCNTDYTNLYKTSSISFGGNYYYPKTRVFLIFAGNDEVGALNQGLTYYRELIAAKSPFVEMRVLEGVQHATLNDSLGYTVLKNLLKQQLK